MSTCNACDFCNNTQHPELMGRGHKGAKIMFIQDSVTELESKKRIQFFGKSCDNLRATLRDAGVDVDDIYWTSVVKCPLPEENWKLTIKESKECSYTLFAEIQVIDPDIIVPTGKISLKYILNRSDITNARGKASEVEICDRKRIVLPIIHPRHALKKPMYKSLIKKDIETLSELIENGLKEVSEIDYKKLETADSAIEELDRMEQEAEWICFDLETTGLSPFEEKSKIVCISLTDKTHAGYVIPLYHHESPIQGKDLDRVVKRLKRFLENPHIKKIAHNGKFDIKWLDASLGIKVANFCFDTMLAHYLCISEEQGTQGLKGLAWEFTDMGGYDNALDEFKQTLPADVRNNYDYIPWSILSDYAVADVDCSLRLWEIFYPKIQDNPKWSVLMSDFLMPASYALKKLEIDGIVMSDATISEFSEVYPAERERIQKQLESYPEVLEIERDRIEKFNLREQIKLIKKADRTPEQQKLFEEYGKKKYKEPKFSWSSTNQLKELLFDKLQLTTSVRTDKGELSTNEDALIEMSEQHELPKLMIELRKIETLNNMFIKKLPEMRDSNNILHPTYNLSGTVTGRLASENPNFQQMPRKAENPLLFQYLHEPKSLFVSRFGKDGIIMNADYSQLELRIAGVISGDKILEGIYKSGMDLHIATASKTFGVPIEEVTKDLRTKAKAVGFGIIYGKSGVTFGKELYLHDLYVEAGDAKGDGKSLSPALRKKIQRRATDLGDKIVEDYLGAYPQLSDWLDNTKQFAIENGYVETMLGRRRRLPDLQSTIQTLRDNALRQAINAPIQGTGSDLTLRSIIEIQDYITKHNLKSRMVGTVHDSIVFDIHVSELKEMAHQVKYIMEHVHEKYIDTEVPILSELEMGDSYGGVFEVELDTINSIDSPSDYFDWLHEQKIKKYSKEIITLHDKNDYSKDMTLKYLIDNHRPVKELESALNDAYA